MCSGSDKGSLQPTSSSVSEALRYDRVGQKRKKLDLSIRCPLYPRKRTNSGHLGMSALCQKRSSVASDEVRCFVPLAVAVRASLGLAAGVRRRAHPHAAPKLEWV